MSGILIDIYIKVSLVIALIDIILAVKSTKKNRTTGRFLGYACAGAALVTVSYLISILTGHYLWMSVMSSIYFINIDLTLINLLIFTVYFTKRSFAKADKIFIGLTMAYTLFEIVVFAVNPFKEIAIHYIPRDTIIARYRYEMMPLYWMHLIFTYLMVASVLVLLIVKMCRIPREYKAQYHYVILGILAIVAVNGIFLFWSDLSAYSYLDYSICGYSLTAFMLYWSCFDYSTHGMLNRLKTSIFENIGQGIVLFDYDDNLILHNQRADFLLGGIQPEKCSVLEDFLVRYGISFDSDGEHDNLSLQCYIKNGEEDRPLRCDIRRLKNKKEQLVGQLFVFSDALLETDLLTGFQNWESFRQLSKEDPKYITRHMAVAICDINSLSIINRTQGNYAGDQQIRMLADTMRQYFPKQTYYVRGPEANLIALCSCRETKMQEYMTQAAEHFDGDIQYAFSATTREIPDVLQAIEVAFQSLRTKKLLDRKSVHSEMLTSLIRALKECDGDTEHHVRRTQHMGAKLGMRIHLTDIQQSRLSLLCLLHDIGKIGIPLEILNKPGKLSDEEWHMLQSHTRKGYEIANSNTELQGIAGEILHHHERWDGHGYPDGLSGEDIPLLSRIIAVVDSYDAMTNDRSYRAALSVSKAEEEIRQGAGSQFDPYIVSEFIKMINEDSSGTKKDKKKHTNGTKNIITGNTTTYSESTDSGKTAANNHIHLVPYSRYILDDSMRIVFADKNFEKLTGYTQEDIHENRIIQADLVPMEYRTEYLCQTNANLAKNPLLFQEHPLLRKDGSTIQVFCFGRMYYDSAVRAQRSEIIITEK